MIEAVNPESSHYEQVVALGNANSRTLGHLPFAAIKQAARPNAASKLHRPPDYRLLQHPKINT